MAGTQIKLNHKGIEELLRDKTVAKATLRRAQWIAAAAGPGYQASGYVGRRARASVITATYAARRDNARRQTLLRSLGAGRRG